MDHLVGLKSNQKMQHVAIIPARGGSKRIPKKNITEFFGKPLIGWTIEAALQSGVFSKVLVSTDSEEIADISRDFGAEVPFLRNRFADDMSPVSEATCDGLIQAEEYWETTFSTVTQLMPNCPLRNSQDIVRFHTEFLKRNIDFLISCFRFGWMNPWWAFKLDDSNRHDFLFEGAIQKRSQDLDPLFCPTGSIWVGRASALKNNRSFYAANQQFFEISWVSAVDIDDEEDLQFAKTAFLNQRRSR